MTLEKMQGKTRCAALGLALLLAGCASAPRGLHQPASMPAPVADADQSVVERAFAETAGALEIGDAAVLSGTPFGTAQVSVSAEYRNGLGERCKRLKVRSESGEAAASVCLTASGTWRYVEPLGR